ncbi:MAG: YkyB family protein [Ectobacillus sp.]
MKPFKSRSYNLSVEQLSQAIFVVNRHAKAATHPKYLYWLKKKALENLILEGKAHKKGLHFSRNPKLSQQQSDVLVHVGDYYFHIPPSKDDFQSLPHLGELNQSYRNPKTHMSLPLAKKLLQQYIGSEAYEQEKLLANNEPWYRRTYLGK